MSIASTYRPWMTAALLAVVYAVGLVGLQTSSAGWFIAATPVTLLLTAVCLLAHHGDWHWRAVAGLVLIAVLGFAVEVVGVRTGQIFGRYSYGDVLGPKVLDVPPVIGLNWLVLVVATGDIARRWVQQRWAAALAAAVAMVFMDYWLVERVAIDLKYWWWAAREIPMLNYTGWLVTSIGLQFLYQYTISRNKPTNSLAFPVLAMQLLFFIIVILTF